METLEQMLAAKSDYQLDPQDLHREERVTETLFIGC